MEHSTAQRSAADLKRCRHVGNAKLSGLELRHRGAKGLPGSRVLASRVQAKLRAANAAGANVDAAAIQGLHGDLEAFALLHRVQAGTHRTQQVVENTHQKQGGGWSPQHYCKPGQSCSSARTGSGAVVYGQSECVGCQCCSPAPLASPLPPARHRKRLPW
jgi:hypothetical protein